MTPGLNTTDSGPTYEPILVAVEVPAIPLPPVFSRIGHVEVSLPHDFVIREAVAASDDDVEDFIAKWGSLVPVGNSLESLPPDYSHRRQAGTTAHRSYPDPFRPGEPGTDLLYLRVLRTLGLHYTAVLEQSHSEDLQYLWSREGFQWWDQAEVPWNAWQLFIAHVNAGLRIFSPRVEFEAGGATWGFRDGYVAPQFAMNKLGYFKGQRRPSTYEVAVLQLAQMIDEEVTVRHCANTNCGRLFTKHRGGASGRDPHNRTRSHLSGIKYCSKECSRAQSARDRAQAKKENTDG